jgi:hypothetical protein
MVRQFGVELVILPTFLAYQFAIYWQTRAGGWKNQGSQVGINPLEITLI